MCDSQRIFAHLDNNCFFSQELAPEKAAIVRERPALRLRAAEIQLSRMAEAAKGGGRAPPP